VGTLSLQANTLRGLKCLSFVSLPHTSKPPYQQHKPTQKERAKPRKRKETKNKDEENKRQQQHRTKQKDNTHTLPTARHAAQSGNNLPPDVDNNSNNKKERKKISPPRWKKKTQGNPQIETRRRRDESGGKEGMTKNKTKQNKKRPRIKPQTMLLQTRTRRQINKKASRGQLSSDNEGGSGNARDFCDTEGSKREERETARVHTLFLCVGG